MVQLNLTKEKYTYFKQISYKLEFYTWLILVQYKVLLFNGLIIIDYKFMLITLKSKIVILQPFLKNLLPLM